MESVARIHSVLPTSVNGTEYSTRSCATWQSRCTDTLCQVPRSGRDRRQRLQQRALQLEQRQWRLAGRAVHAHTGFLHHPTACLGVEVGQIAELAQRHEAALDVFDSRFDDPLLLRVPRGTWVDLEAVSLGALGVGALHDRVVDAGLDDRALGVVDDERAAARR